MSRPLTRSTALSPAWPMPLHLLRTAWADQPFDVLTEYVSGLAQSHLLEIVGESVPMIAEVSPVAGPAGLLPGLVTALRRAGRAHPAPEALSLLTMAPGDSSSLPPVPAVRADVADAGWGLLVRDPDSRTAVCLTCVRPHPDVLRWRARGVQDCPVPPQPPGPSEALADLGRAVVEAAELIERSAVRADAAAPVDIPAHATRLPEGLPSRVLELVDRIDRVEAIISVALAQPEVGVDPAAREPVLRRLVAVKDAARRSAVAAAGEAALREI
ncbi:hypothetical protein [Dietzia sp. ANT_WB102]|uniref:hypothetical protein n=1 Tax=Dietzia sp. ANT_WB102 TaxID=2597345 RepID=UPI0011EC794E|nr:hypothetical protein [Dietzia sp. ANT_WB102]KAA0919702.1 hypothetical protein FQ137_10980 [Dietzia sp. ANT_WB102]